MSNFKWLFKTGLLKTNTRLRIHHLHRIYQDRLSLNAGRKYCKTLQGEHSAILLTSIKLPFVCKTSVLSILSGCLRQVLLKTNTRLFSRYNSFLVYKRKKMSPPGFRSKHIKICFSRSSTYSVLSLHMTLPTHALCICYACRLYIYIGLQVLKTKL